VPLNNLEHLQRVSLKVEQSRFCLGGSEVFVDFPLGAASLQPLFEELDGSLPQRVIEMGPSPVSCDLCGHE